MCDQTVIFVKILENLASIGKTFPLQERVKVNHPLLLGLTPKALTIDIIASTTLDVQLNTQRSPSLPARLFSELAETQALLDGPYTWHNFIPYIRWRRY